MLHLSPLILILPLQRAVSLGHCVTESFSKNFCLPSILAIVDCPELDVVAICLCPWKPLQASNNSSQDSPSNRFLKRYHPRHPVNMSQKTAASWWTTFKCLIEFNWINILAIFLRCTHMYKNRGRASLVAQWLRICLPMQGTRVRALVWEDPTCHGATKPVSHKYWAWASGACAPQRERPRQWEARTRRWRMALARPNWRKPSHRNEDPTQPKINKLIN